IKGHDPKDSTSLPEAAPSYTDAARQGTNGDLSGLKVGVIKQLGGEGYQEGVTAAFEASLEQLRAAGAEIVEVDCPSFDAALAAYYLVRRSEASSSLARCDGMRVGNRGGPDSGPVAEAQAVEACQVAGGFRGQDEVISSQRGIEAG